MSWILDDVGHFSCSVRIFRTPSLGVESLVVLPTNPQRLWTYAFRLKDRVENNHHNHNHNNTNTARSGVEVKPRTSVVPKGVGEGEGSPRVGSRRVGPKGSDPPLPGFRVWVWEGLGSRSECKSLGLGFGLFGFRKFNQNT